MQILPCFTLECRAEIPGLWLGGILHLTRCTKDIQRDSRIPKGRPCLLLALFLFPEFPPFYSFGSRASARFDPHEGSNCPFTRNASPPRSESEIERLLPWAQKTEWPCPVLLPCLDALTLYPGPFAPHCPESSSFLQFLGFDPCVAFYSFKLGDFIPDWISVYSSLPHQITHLVSISSMGPNVTSSLRLPCKSRF